MDNSFDAEEKLYRAVIPKGIYIKDDGSISSAAFKSSNGCSVDRGRGRTDLEAILFMKKKLNGTIYSFVVKNCQEKNIYIRFEPIPDYNPYHCALYKSENLDNMTQGQCKYLSSVACCVSKD